MTEKTPEELQKIVDKWKHVLNPPLSGSKFTAMLLESQEKYFTKEEVDAATPKKNL